LNSSMVMVVLGSGVSIARKYQTRSVKKSK